MQSFDRTGLVAQPADVSGVGGVAQHLAHGVLPELPSTCGASTGGVQPGGERAVGLLSGGVALEQLQHERRPRGVWDGDLGGGVTQIAPRQAADKVALACLLLQSAARPEGQRDGVVLVEHLVDRLGEERGRVGVIFTHRLGDRHDTDAEPLAQKLLVAAGLDLVAGEPRGVEDEHHVELGLCRVGHEALELRAGLGLAPPRMEIAVLADQFEVVLGGEAADALALRVGREALALLLG
ncbi:MAG TPA: hypothetical protein VNX67_09875 [Solirubrobacteraceae bacterium]|nr:hypothetical protein [Solirubrobacteraceae bacterium]